MVEKEEKEQDELLLKSGLIGVYFSGSGNTKYCLDLFLDELGGKTKTYPIEDGEVIQAIEGSETIVLAYPIYYSNLPKIMRDFLVNNRDVFLEKKVFILATMGLFSGDGTGCSARLLRKFGADVIGGLHLKMPDCIADERLLKKPLSENRKIVAAAKTKVISAAQRFKDGKAPREGLGFIRHIAGLFGQRLWFIGKTKHYSSKLQIDENKCIGCGLCVSHCPMNNLILEKDKAKSFGKCTMCYRCINKCPQQAITLLGDTIYEQCRIEKYK